MRHALRIALLLLATNCAFGAIAAEHPPATLSASFENSILRVSGLTPGGQLAIDAVVVEPQGEVAVRVKRVEQIVDDADANGAVEYEFGTAISRRSIWGLVDVSSGGYLVATPPGFLRKELPFPSEIVKNTSPEDYDQLIHKFLILQMLWVRPGDGAWMGTSADGGAGDGDAKNNGETVVSLNHLKSRREGSAAPPKKIKKGDVLILIDPFDLTFTSTTVTQ